MLVAAGCMLPGLAHRSLPTAAEAGAALSPSSRLETLANRLPAALPVSFTQSRARELFAGLPLIFEPNQGQANLDPSDPRARFLARGPGYAVLLGPEGASLRLYSHASPKSGANRSRSMATTAHSLEMKLVGANSRATLAGAEILPGDSNYLLGNDPAKWRRGIPQFARVRYGQVYPGIDLVFYGNQGRLEYDFQVAPGADPRQAELEFNGAQKVQLQNGALVIRCKDNDRRESASVRLEAPHVYQQIDGREQPVEASFVLRGRKRAGFAIGAYDRSRELVIDPKLNFATYFGGSADERQTSVAVDAAGNIYLSGSTDSLNLPVTAGVLQTTLTATPPNTNVYIAKMSPPLGTTPAALIYVTYLGGTGSDYPVGIGVDSAGDAYVAGTTTSTDFPTRLGYQSAPEVLNGQPHVFVSRLDPLGASLQYGTYLSGNGTDIASGMTIDSGQDVYITGTTTSVEALLTSTDQFPATQVPNKPAPFQNGPRGTGVPQFFVTKVYTGTEGAFSVVYSTYFGGGTFFSTPNPIVMGGGIAVDTNLNVYFSGTTNFVYTGTSSISDFPILNAYQPCLDQAPPTTITNPVMCTYTTNPTNPDAFAAKLNISPNVAPGEELLWSTYLGGSQNDTGAGIALNTGATDVYVVGTTNSPDFVSSTTIANFASFQKCLNNLPVTPASGSVTCSTTPGTNTDAYVARLSNPTNSSSSTATNVSLTYFSYLGGQNNDEGLAIAVDSSDGAVITGWTQSPANFVQSGTTYTPQDGTFPVFPYPSTVQSNLNGTQDAFIARLNTDAQVTGQNSAASWATFYGGSQPPTALGEGTGVFLDDNNNAFIAGDTNATNLQVPEALPTAANGTSGQYNGGQDAFVAELTPAASLSITGILTLGPNQTYISAGNQATFTYTLTNNGPDLANGITVTDDIRSTVTGVPLTYDSATATGNGSCSQVTNSSIVTCNIPQLQAGSTATITVNLTPQANSSGNQQQFNGGAVQASATNSINTATISVPATVSDFTISVSPGTVAIPAAGDTASYQVQIIPHPVYGNAISLSVTGQPTSGSTASFTTPSVTLQGTSGATSTLNVTTTARPILTPAASLFTRRSYAIWLAVPGLALLGVGGNRRRRRMVGILLAGFLFAILLLQPACSHNSTPPPVSGTPAGTYNLVVTATSGSDTKNFPVVLTVP